MYLLIKVLKTGEVGSVLAEKVFEIVGPARRVPFDAQTHNVQKPYGVASGTKLQRCIVFDFSDSKTSLEQAYSKSNTNTRLRKYKTPACFANSPHEEDLIAYSLMEEKIHASAERVDSKQHQSSAVCVEDKKILVQAKKSTKKILKKAKKEKEIDTKEVAKVVQAEDRKILQKAKEPKNVNQNMMNSQVIDDDLDDDAAPESVLTLRKNSPSVHKEPIDVPKSVKQNKINLQVNDDELDDATALEPVRTSRKNSPSVRSKSKSPTKEYEEEILVSTPVKMKWKSAPLTNTENPSSPLKRKSGAVDGAVHASKRLFSDTSRTKPTNILENGSELPASVKQTDSTERESQKECCSNPTCVSQLLLAQQQIKYYDLGIQAMKVSFDELVTEIREMRKDLYSLQSLKGKATAGPRGSKCGLEELKDVCPMKGREYEIPDGKVHIGSGKLIDKESLARLDLKETDLRKRVLGLAKLYWPGEIFKWNFTGKDPSGNKINKISDNDVYGMTVLLKHMENTEKRKKKMYDLSEVNVRRTLSKALSEYRQQLNERKKRETVQEEKEEQKTEGEKREEKKNDDVVGFNALDNGGLVPLSESSSGDEDQDDDDDDQVHE